MGLDVAAVADDEIRLEWDAAGEVWADYVRGGRDYYREEMNNPAFFKLLGSIRGMRVLDLACGEGSNTRILAGKGAAVVGVDFSAKMIELAKQKEAEDKQGIAYLVSDAADLREMRGSQFDAVTCFMGLMDIEHYGEALSEVGRVLKSGGRFVFSITHPCFEWGTTEDGEVLAEWRNTEGGEPQKTALRLEVNRYFDAAKCRVEWTKRVVKPFATSSFHRTLTDYFEALHEAGLLVSRLAEPKPSEEGVLKDASLRKHVQIPHSIIIEATKIGSLRRGG